MTSINHMQCLHGLKGDRKLDVNVIIWLYLEGRYLEIPPTLRRAKIQKVVDIRKLHNAQNSNQSNLLLSPFATPWSTGKSDHRKLHNSVCASKAVNHNQTVVYHMMLSHVLSYS